MGKVAINVVLIPPEEVMEKALQINRELIKSEGDDLVLDKENCVPHISLSMGVVDEKDLGKIGKILNELLSDFPGIDLEIYELGSKFNIRGNRANRFRISENSKLRKIHEKTIRALIPFFDNEVSSENFFTPPEIRDPTVSWVRNYLEEAAFDNFTAHISLGFGKYEGLFEPFTFKTSKIALYHLGDYCTCRKKLLELELSN